MAGSHCGLRDVVGMDVHLSNIRGCASSGEQVQFEKNILSDWEMLDAQAPQMCSFSDDFVCLRGAF